MLALPTPGSETHIQLQIRLSTDRGMGKLQCGRDSALQDSVICTFCDVFPGKVLDGFPPKVTCAVALIDSIATGVTVLKV